MIVSFSRLGTVDNCRHCYYLQYITECGTCRHYDGEYGVCDNTECLYFGKEMARSNSCNKHCRFKQEENAFAQSGSFVHELMEGYAKGWLAAAELPELFDAYFEDYVSEQFPFNQFADLRESYYSGSRDYLADFDGFGEDFEVVDSEIDFTIKITEEDFLHGYIDLLLRNKKTGSLIVCDYKSKAKFKSKEEQAHYARQLYLYSLFIREQYGKYPDELWFIMFRKQNIVKINFDEKSYIEAQKWMYAQLDEMKKLKEFPAKYDDFFCTNLCNFRNSCLEKERARNNAGRNY